MLPDWIPQFALAAVGILGSGTIYYYLAQRRPVAAIWAGCVAGVLAIISLAVYLHNQVIARQRQADKPVFQGRIYPAAEPVEPDIPLGVFSLELGNNLRVLTRAADHFIFVRDGKPFLAFRVANGSLSMSATITDIRGEHIIKIIDNEFQASPERAFNPKQPDDHSLVARDLDGNEVVHVRYRNPRTIWIVGRFNMPGYREPVIIDARDGIVWPGGGGINQMTVDITKAPNASLVAF